MSAPLPRFKVGNNRGRRRIWLDGKRLVDAGFTGGTIYRCVVRHGLIVCEIPEEGDREPIQDPPKGTTITSRRVTGRPGGKPIIDMVGGAVATAFPTEETVKVRFEAGRITITPG